MDLRSEKGWLFVYDLNCVAFTGVGLQILGLSMAPMAFECSSKELLHFITLYNKQAVLSGPIDT